MSAHLRLVKMYRPQCGIYFPNAYRFLESDPVTAYLVQSTTSTDESSIEGFLPKSCLEETDGFSRLRDNVSGADATTAITDNIGLGPLVPNEADPAVLNEADSMVPNEADLAVPNEADPLVPNEADPAVPNEADSTVPNEADPAVPNKADPLCGPEHIIHHTAVLSRDGCNIFALIIGIDAVRSLPVQILNSG